MPPRENLFSLFSVVYWVSHLWKGNKQEEIQELAWQSLIILLISSEKIWKFIKYTNKAFEVFAIYLGFSIEESRRSFEKK